MNTAQQIKSFYVTIDPNNGQEIFDWDGMIEECELKGEATQDWESESTEYDFPDGSVLIISGPEVRTYGSR